MNKALLRALLCGTALATFAGASTAIAADEPAAKSVQQQSDDATHLDEIVVTAQKRSERLQDVPLAISAFTEETIEQQGIDRIDDYASRAAGVRVSRDGSQANFTIRGIASATGSDTTSATAGIYIDDYPIYDTWFRFSSPDLRIFDVERIEVLRGPQGTLYGATSLAGSIRIITNKPDLDRVEGKFEGGLATTDGGDMSYAANGMFNTPLMDGRLGLRGVAYVREDGGYVDNPVRGESNVNQNHSYGGRLYLSAEPSDTVSLIASLAYQHDEQDDQGATYYYPPAGRSNFDWNSYLPAIVRSDLLIANASANIELGSGNLNLSATYGENSSRNQSDATFISTLFGAPALTNQLAPSDSDTRILEARYTSDATGPFRYTLGAYYNSRHRTVEQQIFQDALIPIWGTNRIYQVYAAQDAKEYAVFGEGTWSFAKNWEATLGLRVFRNDYQFFGEASGLVNNLAAPLTVYQTDVGNREDNYTPRLSLSWKPSRSVNIYATASKGYRFGLTNYNSGASAGTPLLYKSDMLWNYELGSKLVLLEGRATWNTALFYIDWTDIQLPFRNANNQTYVTNAGDARSYGLESEFNYQPDDHWQLNGALSVSSAELTTDNPGIVRRQLSVRGPEVLGVRSGDRLPGSQKLSFSAGVQYNIGQIAGGDTYVRVDDVYVGSSYVDFIKEGSLKLGGYNLINLRTGWRSDAYELVVYANNLFNSDSISNAVPNSDLFGTDAAFRVRPRTVGVTFRARY
ncbi:TonB-dependent receptor [soil metagenome]